MGATVTQTEKVEVSYDRESDVLYLSIGKPRPAVTRGETNGLLVRADPQTHQVVGLTVLDYEKKFRQLDDISWIEKHSLPDEIADFLKTPPAICVAPKPLARWAQSRLRNELEAEAKLKVGREDLRVTW